MADLRNRMKRHVKAAKEWLGKAEQSFEQENEIRGDLNLMLARAELKRAQEAKSSSLKENRRGALLTHGMLALGLAGLVMAFGFVGPGFREAKPVNAVVPESAAKAALPAIQPGAGEKARAEPAPARVQPARAAGAQTPIDTAARRETPPAVQRTIETEDKMSPEQMQHLMRAAGKSLRGQ